jgi:hypothetical protein
MDIKEHEHQYEKPDEPIPVHTHYKKKPRVNQHGGDEKWYQ